MRLLQLGIPFYFLTVLIELHTYLRYVFWTDPLLWEHAWRLTSVGQLGHTISI